MTDTYLLHDCTSTASTQQQQRQDHGHDSRQTNFICEREHTTMRTGPKEYAHRTLFWYGFVCCSLVVHLAIHKNRRKGRQRRVGREGGRGSDYFLYYTTVYTHNTLAVRVLSGEHTGERTVLREESRRA